MDLTILKKSIDSGIAGASAMSIQVGTLMWMRTIMNHQYRYGGAIRDTVQILYKEGGIPRFYRGLLPALVQGPISRFGDTFSNTLALSFCQQNTSMPIVFQTAFASCLAGGIRIGTVPIDTIKTSYQVDGNLSILKNKLKTSGPRVLFNGAIATSTATIAGHYPWFFTFNYLNSVIPKYNTPSDHFLAKYVRNAGIGFTASVISDTVSNSFRVLKTSKQTMQDQKSYIDIAKEIIKKDGIQGILGRGLKIRIMTNGIQGLMFSVLWKAFEAKS